jgi:hypothetical protein
MDCVELAIKGQCNTFTSLPCVQRIADILWSGKVDSEIPEANNELIDRYYSNDNKK